MSFGGEWPSSEAEEPDMATTFPPVPGGHSPWGFIETVLPLGPDAAVVITASHGGVCVSAAGLARIPQPLRQTPRSAGGWFEEDCDWAIPYLALGLDAFEAVPERAVRLAAARRAVWTYHRDHAARLGVTEPSAGGCSDG